MFDAIIQSAASRWSVPESWIRAVIEVESSWNEDAVGGAGAVGLMQIMPATGAGYGVTIAELADPDTNIDTGTHLLADLIARFGHDFQRVYSAYNSGSPDLWETSSEVAEHVQKAVLALERWSGIDAPGGGGMAVFLMLLFWIWRRSHG
jgi:soluble lytic murein transglycosylase-like protein